MLQVTDNTFTADVLESEQPVLVDFWAAWCGPCRIMDPILEEIAAERDDLKLVGLDVDVHQETVLKYGVMSMPTFMVFQNGAPVMKVIGSRPKKRLLSELAEALEQQPAGR
jgi:thioredoxin 1